jgi:hypothetical protein
MEKFVPPAKPVRRETDSHEIVDGSRLLKIGVRTGDKVTEAAGTTRLIKKLGTNISPGLAKILGLDQTKIDED